jgi:hypothetical protein
MGDCIIVYPTFLSPMASQVLCSDRNVILFGSISQFTTFSGLKRGRNGIYESFDLNEGTGEPLVRLLLTLHTGMRLSE